LSAAADRCTTVGLLDAERRRRVIDVGSLASLVSPMSTRWWSSCTNHHSAAAAAQQFHATITCIQLRLLEWLSAIY